MAPARGRDQDRSSFFVERDCQRYGRIAHGVLTHSRRFEDSGSAALASSIPLKRIGLPPFRFPKGAYAPTPFRLGLKWAWFRLSVAI